MSIEPAGPNQKIRTLAPRVTVVVVLIAVVTLIAVGLVLAGPAYAG